MSKSPTDADTSPRTNRFLQVVLIVCTIAVSWLGMQIIHEVGHMLGAGMTGGSVVHVELKPWSISRTDVSPNPHPLFERWAGPIFGTAAPLLVWLTAHTTGIRWSYLLRFFAGFCLVANGAYIGNGVFLPVGDASDILEQMPSRGPLALFGFVTIPLGFAFWDRQGPRFGLGPDGTHVDRQHTIGCACVLAVILVAEVCR